MRLITRGLLACVCLTMIGMNRPMAASPAHVGSRSHIDSVAGLPPEVRLRKLHLVRPDLIPYPIAYEVVC
jgi:hypothetical protein